MTMTSPAAALGEPMTTVERARFERDGFLLLPGVLDPDEVDRYRRGLDAVHPGGVLHELGAVAACPTVVDLVDHPAVLGRVSSVLGWNLHVYHSHLDVHPPVPADQPERFVWHQDGGRQNLDLETDPRARLSVKVAWWLSDLSEAGRGNLRVIPGSHRRNTLDRPPNPDVPWPEPAGAVDVLAEPGDALLFDRRLWHARSDNHSAVVRQAIFVAYTYRWIVSRDPVADDDPTMTPIQRQLLGLDDHEGDDAWGRFPERVPLYEALTSTVGQST
jgi:hypothetical protein